MRIARWSLVALGLLGAWMGVNAARAEIELPGTQPDELDKRLRSPTLCDNCHAEYAPYAHDETWRGSMMANSARDPLFLAALTVADQDVPNIGDLCIRCHAPGGWLQGRSKPFDGSSMRVDDPAEGVQCDFCHRLQPPPEPELLGTSRYFVADDFVRRGPLGSEHAPHETQYSAFHESSELCGTCHDISNPLLDDFPLERTYSEWKQSAFPEEGETCQDCHMDTHRGPACGARGAEDHDVHEHYLAGGNAWIPRVLAGENPDEDPAPFEAAAEAARATLRSAATVELQTPMRFAAVTEGSFTVKVTNLTGHKMPTGYPEGRRCWLEIRVTDASGRVLLHSGAYDTATARREEDPQLRTYETDLAIDGEKSFHFALNNERLSDTRIPPRGFEPTEDTRPIGRRYPERFDGSLAHWDEAPYGLELPQDAVGPLTIEATLWYQTASREYVEFLRDENFSDDRGERLYELWEKYDRAPPVKMASDRVEVPLDPIVAPAGGGCQCSAHRRPRGPAGWCWVAAAAWLARRLRGSTRRGR